MKVVSVHLDSPVDVVKQTDAGVAVTTRDGRVFSAQRAIFALSPRLAGLIRFEPNLPIPRDDLCARLPLGSIIKTHMYYKQVIFR